MKAKGEEGIGGSDGTGTRGLLRHSLELHTQAAPVDILRAVPSAIAWNQQKIKMLDLNFGGRDGIRTHDLLIANEGKSKLRCGVSIT